MKNPIVFTLPILMFILLSCQTRKQATTSSFPESQEHNEHHAANSLDWTGTYKGVLPCADCEGIETEITLRSDRQFTKKTKYLGKETNSNQVSGNFKWNQAGNTILLEGIEHASNQYFVGENTLTHLDLEGNKITSDLASRYVLRKILPMESTTKETLTGVQWTLIELFGKTVEPSEQLRVVPYLVFVSENNKIYGSGGCNRYNGTFDLKDFQRITLTGMATTMMACPDMVIEREFFEALNNCDNFTLADGILSLNKARMAPMARFKAETLKN